VAIKPGYDVINFIAKKTSLNIQLTHIITTEES
jgi:hypothetical protein